MGATERPSMPWPSGYSGRTQAVPLLTQARFTLMIYYNASECAGKHAMVYFAELMKSV